MGFHSGLQNFLAIGALIVFLETVDAEVYAELLIPVYVLSMVMIIVTPVVAIADVVWPFIGRDGDQTLHDRIVGSHVVNISYT